MDIDVERGNLLTEDKGARDQLAFSNHRKYTLRDHKTK